MAFGINTVTISGNLTRDPELRSAGTDQVCGMRIAYSGRKKDSSGNWVDVPNYFDVNLWGGLGSWIAANLVKGDGIVVKGELRWREWQDKDGNTRQAVDITARDVVPVPRAASNRPASNVRSTYEADLPPFQEDVRPFTADESDIPF